MYSKLPLVLVIINANVIKQPFGTENSDITTRYKKVVSIVEGSLRETDIYVCRS
jgi:hypothetical protein